MLPERPADVDDVILQYFPQLAHVGDQCSVAVELGQAGRKIVSISTFRRLRIFMQRVGFQLHTVAVPIMSQLGVSLTNSRATTFSRLIWSSTLPTPLSTASISEATRSISVRTLVMVCDMECAARSEEPTSELQSLMRI